MSIKTSAIQSFKGLSVDILYTLFLLDHDFSITIGTLVPESLPTKFPGYVPANLHSFMRMSMYLLKSGTNWNKLKSPKTT